jgi:hypothetical protein
MNTSLRTSLSACFYFATAVAALLLVPLESGAQGGNNTQLANTAYGSNALLYNTTGYDNCAFGVGALFSNTTGFNNTANGVSALLSNTTGYDNAAFGLASLASNSMGNYNTADGSNTLRFNTTGLGNTANGYATLYTNTIGSYNLASGFKALFSNTTGSSNIAIGLEALYSNTTGYNNTASGSNVLYSNNTGYNNTADGYEALHNNTTGYNNTAIGFAAIYDNVAGAYNIALGYEAGFYLTGNYNIAIGNTASASDNGVIRIGTTGTHKATFIAGISGATASGGVEVFVNSSGQLGTVLSSRRFKRDIKDMGGVSEKLMQLRPVTFRYNNAAEHGPHARQYGLIAEEVAKVYPDLVQYDKAGKPFTVYYHLLTPMLLNEFQKEHQRNAEQQGQIASLKSKLAAVELAQAQQSAVLTKLSAYVQTAQRQSRQQQAAFIRP